MTRTTKRSTRLKDIEEYLLAKRQPVPMHELAAHFGVDRSTIYRSLLDLENEWDVPIIKEPVGTAQIDRTRYLTNVRLNLDEATSVFLAARLLARYSDKPNPHAVHALNKLSIALQNVTPQMAQHISQTSERLDRPLTGEQREYLECLHVLTRAWADGVRVALVQRGKEEGERLFEPYFIEPSAVGFSTYVIGFDHLRHAIRTFKIERLLRARLTADTYTIPATFNPQEKLAGAWGVNWGDGGAPTDVTLRFSAGRVAQRVQETNWHESQRIEMLPDGRCLLHIKVGSTMEMKPWIRAWGPDCEVLAPETLRTEIADDMRKAGQLYNQINTEDSR